MFGPQGFWGAGGRAIYFQEAGEALLIIERELGSKHLLLGI